MHRRIAFKSLGCRVNFEEIDCLRGQFVDDGFTSVPFDEEADVYVINTCTVTGLADAEWVVRKPYTGDQLARLLLRAIAEG